MFCLAKPAFKKGTKEMSQERIDMLKEMIEQSVNPAGWIGYYEGKIATFLFKQEDVPRFLENTDPVGSVVPVYTHPAKTLTDEEINKIYLKKYDGHMGFLSPDEVRNFARTILRKAQEK
jgi:hypothetical protein